MSPRIPTRVTNMSRITQPITRLDAQPSPGDTERTGRFRPIASPTASTSPR